MPVTLTAALSILAIATFSATLLYATYTDFREMRITNKTCLVGAGAYGVYSVALLLSGETATLLSGLAVAASVFAVTALMNAKSLLGGGDVKLLTVLALWTGTQHFIDTFFIVALCGGAVAFFFYARMTWFSPSPAGQSELGQNALDARPIPYGPGITIAGLFLSSELILNALS